MLRSLALGLVLLVAPACTSTGYDRAASAADRTKAYHEELLDLRAQVGVASDALRALSETRGESQRSNQETLQTYRLEIESLERLSGRTRRLHGKVEVRAQAFFGGWTTDAAALTSAELRESDTDCRQALAANFSKLEQGQSGLESALAKHVLELRELALYFGHGLSSAGLTRAQRSIQAAFVNGALLQDQIGAQAALARRAAEELEPLEQLAPEVRLRGDP
jgi:hypothetical protein